MKKLIGLLAAVSMLLIACAAGAELSTNLKIVTVADRLAGNKPATETYVDADGEPVIADDKGYATIRYTYEGKDGRIRTIELLDTKGKLINGREGYARIERRYQGSAGMLKEQKYYDAAGNPVNGPKGYARYEVTISSKGREEWQYDAKGEPVNTHRITLYATGTQVKSDSWYDADNHLTAGPNGYARMEVKYKDNIETRVSYYDENGNLFYYAKAGYARMEQDVAQTRATESRYYNAQGELSAGPKGYARVKYSYAAGGRKKEIYYNADGSLYYTAKGICGMEQVIKGQPARVTEEYYFISEKKRGLSKDGYSGVKQESDRLTQYVDENDQLMTVKKLGYSQVKTNYKNGKVLSREYLDPKGKPVLNKDGYAYMVNQYGGKKQRLVGTTYYGTDKKTPVNNKDGYAKVTYTLNGAGKAVSTKWYDEKGEPCKGEAGAEEVRNKWSGGLKTLESYWDGDGEARNGKDGYHLIRMDYNGTGLECRRRFYDTEDNRLELAGGYAEVRTEYNSQGGKMSVKYYNAAGEMVLTPGKEYAYEKTILMQDLGIINGEEAEAGIQGTLTEYYGTDGEMMTLAAGYAYVEKQTNAAGKVTRESYFDEDGNRVCLAEGYDELRNLYDGQGNVIQTMYCTGGEMKDNADGVAVVQRQYDDRGLMSAEWYLNEECIATTHLKKNYHRVEKTYLDAKHVTSEAWFDPWGQPIARDNTYSKIERSFDDRGNTAEERYYGPDGALIACRAGYDTLRREYNEQNKASRTAYYLNGEPFTLPEGYAAKAMEYDEAGNVCAETYFDGDGQPAECTGGYAGIRKEYDENRRVIRETYLDRDGQPTVNSRGVYGTAYEYDENGRVILEQYFDDQGQPMECTGKYSGIARTYDEEGQQTGEEYLMPDGSLWNKVTN